MCRLIYHGLVQAQMLTSISLKPRLASSVMQDQSRLAAAGQLDAQVWTDGFETPLKGLEALVTVGEME